MSYEKEICNITADEIEFIVIWCGWPYFPSSCLHLVTVLLSDAVPSVNEDKFKLLGIDKGVFWRCISCLAFEN